MKKIVLSGRLGKEKFVLVDDAWFETLNHWTWNLSPEGYAVTAFRKPKWQRIYMHRLIMGYPDGKVIDHINADKLDNQRHNLRACGRAENCRRYALPKTNRSGQRGVSWSKCGSKWQSSIQFKGQHIYLGLFENIEDAARAYNRASAKYHGDYGYKNPV